jgi:hypothetical protein
LLSSVLPSQRIVKRADRFADTAGWSSQLDHPRAKYLISGLIVNARSRESSFKTFKVFNRSAPFKPFSPTYWV